MKIKVKTFSKHKLLDINDLMLKVAEHLKKTNQEFCFLADGRMITREDCRNYGAKF